MASVQKWGNSLAVRIPARLAETLAVRDGTQVDLELADGALVVRPTPRPRHRLSELLRACTPQRRHGEDDFGPDVGAEVIG